MTNRTLLLAFIVLFPPLLRAEHLPGGSITYECLGGNTYTVTLTLLRECSGEAMVPQDLRLSNDCGVVFSLAGLVAQEVADVSPLCAGQAASSNCNGGSLFGVQAHTYRQTLFLSPCNAWTIAWSTCCRQSSINVQNNPGLYIEARLNNAGDLCTNSPVFNEASIPVVCAGQPVVYDPGVSESDGHTLQYSFIEARFGTPAPFAVIYSFPYFGLEPFSGMQIDPNTGIITFTPTIQGYVVTVIQVDEYDADSVWIGSVMRDFPFLVRACAGAAPVASTGLITGVSGVGQQTGDRSVRICDNGTFCMDLSFTPNSGQELELSSNIATVLPGATITRSGTSPVLVQICWDATNAPPQQANFTIVASNEVCPIPATQWYSYSLSVEVSPDSLLDGSALACPQTEPFALVDSLGTFPTVAGTWSAPNGDAHPGIFTPGTDPDGAYTFTMETFPGCNTTALVNVQYLDPMDTLCSQVSVPELMLIAPTLFPNPTSGTITLRSIGLSGKGPFIAHISDQLGRNVAQSPYAGNVDGTHIELPKELSNGLYLLHLEFSGGMAPPARFMLQR